MRSAKTLVPEIKKPDRELIGAQQGLDLFSSIFNVARNPV